MAAAIFPQETRWTRCHRIPRWFRFASPWIVNIVAASTQRGVRRAGLRLGDVRLLYPPNLMRVMPP